MILVFDITSAQSFNSIKTAYGNLKMFGKYPILIAGNKIDNETDRNVQRSDAEAFAASKNTKYYEVSAQSGYNVDDLFGDVAKFATAPPKIEVQQEPTQQQSSPEQKNTTSEEGSCCRIN